MKVEGTCAPEDIVFFAWQGQELQVLQTYKAGKLVCHTDPA
jgi:hypothetical protein